MKLTSVSSAAALVLLASTDVVSKYVSEGWKPGQPARKVINTGAYPLPTGGGPIQLHDLSAKAAETVEEYIPEMPHRQLSLLESITESVHSATGVNLTKVYGMVQGNKQYSWDNDTIEGFTRLTDANYEEEVVYELFKSDQEERDRLWVIQIHGAPGDPSSRLSYEAFKNASLETMAQGDLKHVRFGRIDFMTETRTCAKWLVFKPPAVVFVTDRGSTLRFAGLRQIGMSAEGIRELIKTELWKEMQPWESEWAPGGNKAWIVNAYLKLNYYWSLVTDRVPTWVMLIFSALLTQTIMGQLHKKDLKKAQEREKAKEEQLQKELEQRRASGRDASSKPAEVAVGKKEVPSTTSKRTVKGKKDDVTVTVETKKAK